MAVTTTAPPRQQPQLRPAGWWVEAVLLAVFVALTVALARHGPLTSLDLALRDWSDAHRPVPLYWIARVVNFLGNGGPIMTATLLLSFLLAWRQRSVWPIFPPAAVAVLSVIVIVPLKRLTDRPAPHYYGSVDAFSVSGQESYPSGHLLNTIIWYGVLALLLAPYLPPLARRLIRILPPVLVFASTIYLGFHWFTDDVAGLALGIVLYRLVVRLRRYGLSRFARSADAGA